MSGHHTLPILTGNWPVMVSLPILSRDCHFQEQGISFRWCQERLPSIP